MEHEGIERIEVAAGDNILVNLAVAIGEPALPIVARAGVIRILAAAPDGVGLFKPERGGPGAGGLIDIDIGLAGAQVRDEAQHRFEIANGCISPAAV